MTLSIIIVNYKSAQLVLDCITSVYEQTWETSFEIILVDNNSGDDCKERVLEKFPGVQWIQTGYNAGFARANNAGIRVCKGEYVLLLNSDTIILDRALDKTIALFSREDAAGCGVQLLNTDGSYQISGAHFVKGGLNFLLPLPYLGRFVRYWGYKLKTRIPSITEVSERVEVDWIVGAFLMARRTAIDKAGLLDEDFFMYAEEIEWCSRLRKQGKMVLYSEPKVIHIGGATSGSFYDTKESENSKNLWNRKGRQIMLSMFVRTRKQYGVGWFLLMLSIFVFDIPVFFLGLLIEKVFKFGASRYSFRNFSDYTQNVWCLVKHSPKIIRNKPHFYKV
ncbi:MAG: glycosyltransferase family 2 protein [Bacteroidota bacterium]